VAIARIAGGQHGIVTVAQLAAVGVDKSAVTRRLRAGRLHRLHRGVYAVGHAAPGNHRNWMAAVLACGEGAVLSHTSAAVLWGFLKPSRGPIHVSLPSLNGRRRRSGLVIHRSASLATSPVALTTLRFRIPVTTPRRTIEDLPAVVPSYLVRRAKRQAEFLGYELRLPTDRSRSDLESDFLSFCRRHRLPLPELNVEVGPWEVDFVWPERMVAVETDFFDYHRGSQAFEDDHQRELDLRRAGYAVRRFTGAQIRKHPALVVADLRAVLRIPAP
jgi:very-short-patch-repair endonuclease